MPMIEWDLSQLNFNLLIDFIAAILIGWDLLISKQQANRVNRTLRNWLNPPRTINRAFIAGIVFEVIIVVAIIIWSVYHDLQNVSIETANFTWIPVFFLGLAIGIGLQWCVIRAVFFFTKAPREQEYMNQYVFYTTMGLSIIAVIIFTVTIQHRYLMVLSLGNVYGIAMLEISILLLAFFRWFLTSDPNPMAHPRVISRFGLLLFLSSKIFELFGGIITDIRII